MPTEGDARRPRIKSVSSLSPQTENNHASSGAQKKQRKEEAILKRTLNETGQADLSCQTIKDKRRRILRQWATSVCTYY